MKRSRSTGARRHQHDAEPRSRRRASREEELPELLAQDPGGPALFLVLDQVQDPHNLGACLRTASAAGCRAVIAPKNRSAPLNDTVRRISCGGAESVPYLQVTNLARTLRALKEAGVWLVGTADGADRSLYEIDLAGRIAIVMGAEGDGLRRLTAEECDFLAVIPMAPGGVPCLNVSVATGVCLFEAVRQRSAKSPTP